MIIVGLCLDNGKSFSSRFFNTKLMQFLGRISMSLYLFHEPLIFWITVCLRNLGWDDWNSDIKYNQKGAAWKLFSNLNQLHIYYIGIYFNGFIFRESKSNMDSTHSYHIITNFCINTNNLCRRTSKKMVEDSLG